MRLGIVLCFAASTAQAWDFTAVPVCTIWHATDQAEMVVTHDPLRELPYSISVTLTDQTWARATPYSIRFEGLHTFMITTERHVISDDGAAVVASDTGFGNVLKGLESNARAVPRLGGQSVEIPLIGAAAVVQKFRDCTAVGLS